MRRNVGSFECAGRFVLGCSLLIAALHGPTWLFWVALPLLVSTTGRCPLWWLLRIDTTACDQPQKHAHVLNRADPPSTRNSPPGTASFRRHPRNTA